MNDCDNDEYEYKWFWEVDGLYDLDGDLLVWSLMSVGMLSLGEAISTSKFFTDLNMVQWKEFKE